MRAVALAYVLALATILAMFPLAGRAAPAAQSEPAHFDDALIAPPPSRVGIASTAVPRGPSQYMAGDVAILVVLPESDGSIDRSTEDWTPTLIDGVRAQVQAATDWWARQLPRAGLRFQLRFVVAPTAYEPSSRGLADEGLWIGDALGRLGYRGPTYFDQAYAAVDALRAELGADWGTVLFVPNTANGSGYLADGRFAYAYINGPLLVVTSDAGGYGTQQLAPVIAHELGHTFGALDQYVSARVPCDRRSGYLDTPTTNSQYGGCGTNLPSIMLDAVAAYKSGSIDPSALHQIGYRDSDGDAVIDPLDTAPALELHEQSLASGTGRPVIRGSARDVAFPSSGQAAVTLHAIAAIEYRVDGGVWIPVGAQDGAFDSAAESFLAELPLYDGSYSLEVRALNSAGMASPLVARQLDVTWMGPAPRYVVSAPAVTASSQVSLQIDAPATTEAVQVSERPDFADAIWQPFFASLDVSLQPGDGQRTLYVRFLDRFGLDSLPAPVTVVLDTQPPRGSAVRSPAEPTRLRLEASDPGSGVVAVELRVGVGEPSWSPFSAELQLPQGTNDAPVQVRFRDGAGNVSAPISATLGYRVALPLLRR